MTISIQAQQQMAQALEMRLAGKSYREIGAAQSVGPGTAHKRVQRALKLSLKEPAESYRVLQTLRYEAIIRANWTLAMGGGEKGTKAVLAAMAGVERLHGLAEIPRVSLDLLVKDMAREEGLDPAAAIADAEELFDHLRRR